MINRFDYRNLMMDCVLSRVDRLIDGNSCWERFDSLALKAGGGFEWLTETRFPAIDQR